MTRDEVIPNTAEVVIADLGLPRDIAAIALPIFSRFLLREDRAIYNDESQRIAERSDVAVTAANFAAYAWKEDVDIAIAVFEAFEKRYCSDQNIHVYVSDSRLDVNQTESVLRAYYAAQSKYHKVKGASKTPVARPALFSTDHFQVMAVFAGQGGMDNYMDETRSVFSIYQPLVEDYVTCMSEHLRKEAAEPELARTYRSGLDALHWIKSPEETPSQEYMISVPVCLPLVGLTQLMQVMVLYKSLSISPGELADKFECITGHSQGIVAAAVLALVTNEESFYSVSKVALGLLMLGGVFPQQDYPLTKPTAVFTDNTLPTPMARVLNLTRAQLESAIVRYNQQQEQQQHKDSVSTKIYLSLTNSSKMHVVSGNTASLSSFIQVLKQEFDTNGADQTRIPFSERKPGVSIKYLSINGPYHCELLANALEGACAYATKKGWCMDGDSLRRPVKTYEDGRDIYGIQDLAHYLLRCMFVIPVDWPAAAKISGVTHVVDFGPGGVSGIGALMHRIYEGQGVSVICAGALNSYGGPLAIKADLYKTDANTLVTSSNWATEYRPRLVRCAADGSIHIDTPMSRLLGKPPVMVAGMTPSTVSEVFVSAVMRAGYHIELSGGGHFSETMLRDKAEKILALVGPGNNITINSIYVNPFLWNIQYPAIKTMRREGIPMDGLCIGAGVPSFEVCNEIIAGIREVGFRHIGLKPSSVATIRLVIKIAQANPDFPVLLQWTGGRAGGHHSFEDFHQPILQTYGAIRAQKNIVLIAGSGFGGVDDTLPYITGDWSGRFECAPMPFDGCLFGSRVMVAKEGAASDAVKEAIVAAPGIDDSEWEKTYNGPAGGIVTVLSEMGEPIHKIATRGVLLWKELDDTVFSLPRNKRLPALLAKKDYIIRRLNKDFQKPWFGKKADGSTADLGEMTYAEVANRLVEVLYVAHQSRWIDVTMRNLVGNYLLRLEERFANADGPAILQSFEQINSPQKQIAAILDAYPECRSQLLTSEDIQFFINLCMRPGQKPVPFIPLMDKDFHIWFKKDSLWQAEDVDAVVGQDVGRVCILQGPVAVRYSTKVNEPVKDILDNIYHGQIAALLERYYDGDEAKVPVVGYLGATHAERAVPLHVQVRASEEERVYTLPSSTSQLPELDAWLETLAGSELTWLRAFLITPIVAQNRRYTSNIAQRVLRPRPSQVVRVLMQDGRPRAVEITDATKAKILDIEISVDNTIRLNMYSSPRGAVCTLELLFRYEAAMSYAPIHEVMECRNDRIKRFYAQVWFENTNDAIAIIEQKTPATFFKGPMLSTTREDIEDFCYAIGNTSERYIAAGGAATIAPLDYAIRIVWPVLCKCIMSPVCDGDLTRLVHLSNGFRVVPGAQPIRPDEQLTSEAQITEVLDNASGRTLRVKCHVLRNSQPVIEIDTSFFFRNHLPDYSSNFKHVSEQVFQLEIKDILLLVLVRSREWLVPVEEINNPIAVGDILQFHLESRYSYQSATVYSHVSTYGTVLVRGSTLEYIKVADVDFECSTTSTNPVLQFLCRHGQSVSNTSSLNADDRNLVGSNRKAESMSLASISNQAYSDASTDHNPIHTSEYFSDLVQLPTTITHGMWTSAAARRAIERIVADGYVERVVAYNVNFVDMVRPGDQLETQIYHTGFADGRLLLLVESYVHGTKVLEGTAEVEQPMTAFTFTGQGAHVPGMGMDLYDSSKVARDIWDSADAFMRDAYGIPLIDIVRNNPQSYTVHFVGKRGAKVRDNYRAMVYEYSERDGSRLIARPLFPEIFESTESFTFFSQRGLLYATQFTQAAMLICEVAEFAHLRAAGVVPEHAAYAGHSLGEYAGLTAIGGVFTPEAAADIGFCRGLTMQQSVRRDAQNRSIYGMVAVSITRVATWFTLEDLIATVAAIKDHGDYDGLLEIVNYNVRGMQYVASGELVLLDALGLMLTRLSAEEHNPKALTQLARDSVQHALACKAGNPHYELHRTNATIPIPGIDVPFHSSLLKNGVWSFRKMLQSKIKPQSVSIDKLCGQYIPNLTARPFQVSEEYIRNVMELTDSAPLAELLDTFDSTRLESDTSYKHHVAYVLLIEVLCHQFSSPVRWIETQDVLLCDLEVLRFIEIGPSNVMSNMLRRTISSPSYVQSGRSAVLMQRVNVLCSSSDMDKILYQEVADVASNLDKPDGTNILLESADKSEVPAHPTVPSTSSAVTSDILKVESASGGAVVIPDVAIQPIEVIRALIAYKLKLGLDSVTGDGSIQDLVGGKSTLQNEIVGDMQKEFGGDLPDKPEEIPLSELAQGLSLPADGLGKVTQGLISRMIASKMPGGYTRDILKAESASGGAVVIPDVAIQPIEVIRALIAYKLKLGLDSVTGDGSIQDLVGGKSTLQNEIIGDMQKEFGGDLPDKPEEIPLSELSQGLSLPADGLGKVTQGLISRMIASKMPGGYTRFSICQHLEESFGLGKQRQQGALLVALTMEPSLGLDSVTGDGSIQDLVGGKSTLQNEIIGDMQKEFGGDLPDKPEEIPLSELSQGLSLPADGLGKVTQGLISRMIASKMPGGYTRFSICQHLEESFGLGKQRQQGALLVALTMEPSVRFDLESGAKDWLATVAKNYAKIADISFITSPASVTGTGRGSGAPTVIKSAEFNAAQKAQHQLARRTIHALAAYLDINIDQAASGSTATAEHSDLAQSTSDFAIWNAEYGQAFCEGIQPVFSAPMARLYDSYWNWARQDLMELYFDIASGKIAKVDLSISSHCLRLMNRITPGLMTVLRYMVQRSEEGKSLAQLMAMKHGASLVKQCTLALNVSPAYQFTGRLLAPRLRIDIRGELEYFEIDRPGEESMRDYADEVLSLSSFGGVRGCTADGSLYSMMRKLGLSLPVSEALPQRALPPMVHLKSKAADQINWSYDGDKSDVLRSIFHDICDNGLSLAGKRALITGCGRGSIGAEVLRGLLEGGAQVVATTSSYSANTTRYFQELYQKHGSRGSSLTIVPFNQASKQDVSRLVEYIYDESSRGKGLGWDLDYVIPFAAIPELGYDLTELDSRSELAHRAMLTNVMRLLGGIALQKAKRRLDMHPTLVVLPLSPNHGAFGYDGHYSESKIGLETLMNRWHTEPTWGMYISIAGAVIGWTRGTGLMGGNNIIAEWVEKTGVRTFTAAEMAFNILTLLHPRAYALAAMEPVWADMGGRFQYYPSLANTIGALHRALAQMRDARKAAAADALADFGGNVDKNVERVYKLHTIRKRANHQFSFPKIKSYEELAHLHHLQGMVNLDQVVVVTGYGEVGPYGNAETRWEMEAFGEFSLEGCIELAWIMGLIKHFNGKHKKSGKVYTGWVDARTEEPVADKNVKAKYEKQILGHTGIRLIEPEGIYGYDPNKKPMMRELQIEHDMEPFETSEEEAHQFKLRNGDKVSIWLNKANGSESWMVRFLKGATLMVPKALRVDRLVAAQLPTGWDPVRYGIPKSIADQIDPISCYALVATVEALLRSGITDPYEIYKYVHVSEVGSSTGTAVGGLRSTKSVFGERLCDKAQQPDVYQEVFLSTPPAWINMLLMSASGPIKTTVGACATGIASIDVAVDTIQSGKAKIMLAGGTDSICEETSYEFAQMNATSSTLSEFEQGRTPREMSRPCTTTRNGFMESEGAGIVTLMSATTAIEMGVPIHGIVAMTGTATDKEGRSVPAPGKGVLTSAREAPCGPAKAQLLEIGYRRRQLELRQRQICEWAAEERELVLQIAQVPRQDCSELEEGAVDSQLEFIALETKRQNDEALTMWGNSFWKRNPNISPLRGSLAVWGLTVDDIGIASFHGTSTKANDKNESEIVEQQLRHLGRTPGNVVFSICQKYLTGHPKGPASIWMLNGVLQVLRTGIVPGNRNADNIAAELEKLEYIVYPSRSIKTPGIKAGLIKSFGFGQVGAECLMVHPDYLLAVLDREKLEQYRARNTQREAHAYRYWHNALTEVHPFVQVKTAPPYTAEEEKQLYLNPLGRVEH
ncbi:hypothetical protein COEREDRAFT_10860 [Coemansia reversa NRRL 1564]|uniref:Uncharacterized protein n=1 Tax=Coemansia reversa (strain ATCC 12441 / NRRL 1564) TaxID=763665 RepID=A0A2G5B4J0_COERN|nr:hypothetical protein COEREDRAFT_10860 [Coemansia reversa NRRL 1564]|eukprot:PIA13919.1 hypothetical protein COEREDRAFT_10860 [Coemansia reversa NRRL 1564]